jgi:hypothetical protein
MWSRWLERTATIVTAVIEDSAELMARKTRQTFLRLLTMAIGAGVALIGLLAFAASVFFQLSELFTFVLPALYTGLIFLAGGLLITVVGTTKG